LIDGVGQTNQVIAIIGQGLSCLEPAINQEQLIQQIESLNILK
jgi:hypothetical protein